MSSRAKGRRTLAKAKEYYESNGWVVDEAELGGKFRKSRDLFSTDDFGGFDLVCVRDKAVKFVQVKTNRPPIQDNYRSWARKYGDYNIHIESYTWYDRRGPVIHKFKPTGEVEKIDLRK